MGKFKSHYLLGIAFALIYLIVLFFFFPLDVSSRVICAISLNITVMALWLLQWRVYEKVISFTDIFFINIIAVISGIAVILITIVNTLLMYIDSVKCKVMIGLTLVIVIIVSFIVGMIVDRNKEK